MKIILISFLLFINSLASSHTTVDKNKHTYKCEKKKKYCKQMTSCKEAMFYLQQCGLKRLDRDKDGIPCEKLCGKN